MRIGELATRAGVSVRALRYYEEHDLLEASRSPSGQRVYPESAVERVELIQHLYAGGLSSKAIVDLLPCVVDGRATAALLTRLSQERDRLTHQAATLLTTRDKLDQIITAATTNAQTGQPCRN
ncbi:MerR family transcriptional regulator [Kribbella endophytica]